MEMWRYQNLPDTDTTKNGRNLPILILHHITTHNIICNPACDRVELHSESGSGKPELIFMDQLDEVSSDMQQYKGENCIVLKTKDNKIVLTNPVRNCFIYGYVAEVWCKLNILMCN